MKKSSKIAAYYFGLFAELFSCLILTFKLYYVIARRFKCPFGEIDLIACKSNCIVFIEIKARKNITHHELISCRQKERIIKAAEFFMIKNPKYQNYMMRFDVIILNKYFFPLHYKQFWH